MSKNKEELNALKGKYEELPEGVTELSMEDLEQVTGGAGPVMGPGAAGVIGQTEAQDVMYTFVDKNN